MKMRMKMKMKMKKETERERKRKTERERERERQRERRKHSHGPQTPVLLREPHSRSQSVACAEVQAGAFKAAAESSRLAKKIARLSDSLVGVS